MFDKMTAYYHLADDGLIHVTNFVGPYQGQHYTITPEGLAQFRADRIKSGIAVCSVDQAKGAACDQGGPCEPLKGF